jgi:YD repeat-containing protein
MAVPRPSWLRFDLFWDTLFAIGDKGLGWTFRWVSRTVRLVRQPRRRPARRPATYLAVEGLEARLVPTLPLTVTAGLRGDDPQRALLLPVGEAEVSPNTGSMLLSQPLDFDLSPGNSVGGDPAIVYDSNTVSVRPIVQAQVPTDPSKPVPLSIQAQLTWQGQPQPWQTFTTSGHSPGDTYLLGLQVTAPVALSGIYDYSVTVQVDYGPGPGGEVLAQGTATGQAPVVVQDSSPLGSGWGIANIDRLVVAPTGVMWQTGSGDERFFTANAGGSYTSPAEDFGTLTRQANGNFTYVAKDQTTWTFTAGPPGLVGGDATGVYLLASVSVPDGQARTYQYDSQGRLVQVQSPDGGGATLSVPLAEIFATLAA